MVVRAVLNENVIPARLVTAIARHKLATQGDGDDDDERSEQHEKYATPRAREPEEREDCDTDACEKEDGIFRHREQYIMRRATR